MNNKFMNTVLILWIMCLIILGFVYYFSVKSIEEQRSHEIRIDEDFGKDFKKEGT